jgi:pyoverdine/dityrosine biosynthesis protein Dit1/AcrR family transcriptional regulator
MKRDAIGPSPPMPSAMLTTQDIRRRQRILEAAIVQLAERGLATTLLEDAAEAAGCSPAQAQVFFGRDEELVLGLYARLAADLEARVSELPDGSLAERFRSIMLAKLSLVAPYREALASLLAALLNPKHELSVLSTESGIIRSRVMGVFSAVVLGARDGHKVNTQQTVRSLYAMHLALMLLWTQDGSQDAKATRAAIDLVRDLLSLSGRLAWLPGAGSAFERFDEIAAPLIEPSPDSAQAAVSRKILEQLFHHRRLETAGSCAERPCEQCFALHLPRVLRFVSANEPIHFLLPAFPAKSPSPKKVLGRLPDMAEELALRFLDQVCDEIKELHSPGARITICSDGRVFSDLVGVTDQDVTDYGQEMERIRDRIATTSLDWFRMEDLFETSEHSVMREQLIRHYAEPLAAIRQRVNDHDQHRLLFNGIQRFLFEDRVAIETDKSRTQVRNQCKELTYLVMQRSDAWGRLLSDCFPGALRLSIHPQMPHAEKIGIRLGEASDAWITPWHGVAVERAGKFRLMRLSEAEKLGAKVVNRFGRPSHLQV